MTELFTDLHPSDLVRLRAGEHSNPHCVLGAHPLSLHGKQGTVVRAFHPDAVACHCLLEDGRTLSLDGFDGGLFATFLPDVRPPVRYRIRFGFADGRVWEHDDPYRHLPTLGAVDEHLFNEGTHKRLWDVLGAHPRQMDGVDGVAFAVWAPNARRVSLVGDFCRWDGRLLPMRSIGNSGIFELFVPEVAEGALYKLEIKTATGAVRTKTDPFAFCMEQPPANASRVVACHHRWGDDVWMQARPRRDVLGEPMAVYEVHLGSWARVPEEGNRPLSYREIAVKLVEHVKALGFNYVELLPVAEHPLTASWGYQVSGYFAPTSRYGTPDDFRFFVDYCHQHDVGVIVDWVPAHFPKDDWALARFDGTALYEHEDRRQGEHPDWGTLIFNYGRTEVRNFLIANALYWLQDMHVDGLRVDAVASMLYLDYSRAEGDWVPNPYGGRENLDAVGFLRAFTDTVRERCPGCFTVAEESTSWGGVTRPTAQGGLGFTLKWNMGWMHDTLVYFGKEPVHRRYHQNELTFSMIYEHTERFIMPLSHDEVVHGKGSLLSKMAGDRWQKLANLRALLTYQYTRPGKKLLFMGTELGPDREWSCEGSLDWHLVNDPMRKGLRTFVGELGQVYLQSSCLWAGDGDSPCFAWIDCQDHEQSVFSYVRQHGGEHLVVVLNLTPVPRDDYRIGVPAWGAYVERLCSDAQRFGGSLYETVARVETEAVPFHGHGQSIRLRLPPLAALVLQPESE